MNTARFHRFALFLLFLAASFSAKTAHAAIEDVRVTDLQPTGQDVTLYSYDQRFSLQIPVDALRESVRAEVVTHSVDTHPLPAGYRLLGRVYQFRVHQTLAETAAEYRVNIEWLENEDQGADLFYWDTNAERWYSLKGYGLLGTHRLTSVLPSGFTEIAVMVPPQLMMQGMASWYAYKDCDCAASPDYPKGTMLKVSRIDDPTRSVIVRINDWGPERDKHPDRVIDLDLVAFKKIANPRGGLVEVRVDLVEPWPTQ